MCKLKAAAYLAHERERSAEEQRKEEQLALMRLEQLQVCVCVCVCARARACVCVRAFVLSFLLPSCRRMYESRIVKLMRAPAFSCCDCGRRRARVLQTSRQAAAAQSRHRHDVASPRHPTLPWLAG